MSGALPELLAPAWSHDSNGCHHGCTAAVCPTGHTELEQLIHIFLLHLLRPRVLNERNVFLESAAVCLLPSTCVCRDPAYEAATRLVLPPLRLFHAAAITMQLRELYFEVVSRNAFLSLPTD